MKCPYAINRETIVETVWEYDDDGKASAETTVQHDSVSFAGCLKDQCGAWKSGECGYKGG